jgi:hypothetical protein
MNLIGSIYLNLLETIDVSIAKDNSSESHGKISNLPVTA